MNKFKNQEYLSLLLGPRFSFPVVSQAFNKCNDDIATSTLNVLSNKGGMQPI